MGEGNCGEHMEWKCAGCGCVCVLKIRRLVSEEVNDWNDDERLWVDGTQIEKLQFGVDDDNHPFI